MIKRVVPWFWSVLAMLITSERKRGSIQTSFTKSVFSVSWIMYFYLDLKVTPCINNAFT